MEAAGADNNAAFGFVGDGTVRTDSFYACAVKRFVAKKFYGFGTSVDRNIQQFAFVEHIAKQLVSARC